MIHEIGLELQKELRSKLCPIPVVDGPEPTNTATWGRERIVIERDRDAGDRFGYVRSQHKNPKHVMTRSIGCKIRIYVQSAAAGALPFEHERRCDLVIDQVLVAMHKIAGARRNDWTPGAGKTVDPVDLEDSERRGGSVYELSFTFDRGVYEQTFKGEIQPEATLGAIASRTDVTLANGPDNQTPVTGCGG